MTREAPGPYVLLHIDTGKVWHRKLRLWLQGDVIVPEHMYYRTLRGADMAGKRLMRQYGLHGYKVIQAEKFHEQHR